MIIIHLSVYVLQAGVKAKKATETYKSFVEKYATAKSEFEQKMAGTAQVFNTWWLPPSVAFNTLLFQWVVCVLESVFHICALHHLQIVFFFFPPSVMESQWKPPDWIHLTGWLDQLQIEIRSVEFGLHILPSAPQQLHHQKWFQWSSLIPGESCAAAPLPPALQSSHLEKPRTCGHEF